MGEHVLAIDQGTTSSRAIVFDRALKPIVVSQKEFAQHYPASGHVEHNAEEIWQGVVATCREALAKAALATKDIAGIGITNQRETVVLWERATGAPLARALVWQDRRTAPTCAALRDKGLEPEIAAKTGLLLDPYFSATKIAFLLDQVPGARERAARGEIAVGTIDSYLLYRLTGGKTHATDATNASRTMLMDIGTGQWDADLCRLFGVPMAILPEIRDCAADFGATDPALFGGAIPVRGMAGDQQAALIGQACFAPGMMKSTYGTGCFALLNIGERPVASKNRLLTTIAYQLGGKRTYALEGSIFIAGAAVQWLRDGLKIIRAAEETGPLALDADPSQDVVLVPAFVGLGAPYWQPEVRGALFGLTRATGPAELAAAALESVAFQTHDLIAAMQADWKAEGAASMVLRVDGGMVASDWTMQRLADILAAPVDRPVVQETTALGAAYLAGMQAGVYPPPQHFAKSWALDRRFSPSMPAETRARRLGLWNDAVRRVLA